MLLKIIDWFVYEILGMTPAARFTEAVHFFLYDTVKIILLLFVLISVIGVIRTYLPQKTIRHWMSRRGIMANMAAALFGAVTPFCSCSSIPLFLGFLEAGVPLGVTFSFLVTSPLINEYLVVLMLGFFGWKITALYVLSGLMIGITAGIIMGRMNLDSLLEPDLVGKRALDREEPVYPSFKDRLRFGLNESCSIVKKVWVWVLVGVGLGAVIHNYVPQEAIQNIINKTGIFSVPIAVILGVPMYGTCAAIVPIAVVLFNKGIPLGTALALMMAIAALSLPEAVVLRRAMRLKLILLFFGITAAGIMFTGYLFNYLQTVIF